LDSNEASDFLFFFSSPQHLALKEVLLEAYEQNRLLVAISFVCKVLEQSSRSKIFKQKNPWLMAQLRLLVELLHLPELPTSIKFEIEILLKALKIELRDIEPSNLLKDRSKSASSPLSGVPPPGKTAEAAVGGQTHDRANEAGGVNSLNAVVAHIVTNANAPIFAQQHMRRYILMSIDRSIKELFSAVVERSAKIACITAREMILKDFAMEPDEQKMRNSANIMVQTLASNLSLVASKDPLRLNIGNNLRNHLQSHSNDHALIEQGIQTVCEEQNIAALCSFFENAASDKGANFFPP